MLKKMWKLIFIFNILYIHIYSGGNTANNNIEDGRTDEETRVHLLWVQVAVQVQVGVQVQIVMVRDCKCWNKFGN